MAKRNTVRTVTARIGNVVLNTLDDVITMARTVTVATFADAVARATANHGVTHAGRNVARFTGQRVVFTQNMTFVRNAEWQLDDTQLLFVWRTLFPMASGALFAGPIQPAAVMVNAIRSHYNRDGHGDPSGKPVVESIRYGSKPAFAVVAPAPPVVPPNPVIVTPATRGRAATTATSARRIKR
jgi:hypothetical protein